ncbi:hypothetical protein VTI28DRAFT_806 [Corynascus sepedonium]
MYCRGRAGRHRSIDPASFVYHGWCNGFPDTADKTHRLAQQLNQYGKVSGYGRSIALGRQVAAGALRRAFLFLSYQRTPDCLAGWFGRALKVSLLTVGAQKIKLGSQSLYHCLSYTGHSVTDYHIRPYLLGNSGSRPLSQRQTNKGSSSSWVGDDQRMPGVVCFCSFLLLGVSPVRSCRDNVVRRVTGSLCTYSKA